MYEQRATRASQMEDACSFLEELNKANRLPNSSQALLVKVFREDADAMVSIAAAEAIFI